VKTLLYAILCGAAVGLFAWWICLPVQREAKACEARGGIYVQAYGSGMRCVRVKEVLP